MKKRIKTVLSLILGAVLLVSLTMTVRSRHQYRESDEAREEAQNLVNLPAFAYETKPGAIEESGGEQTEQPDPCAEALAAIDLGRLQEVNEDVAGWIEIPGTEVSYPILQDENNEYYLNHSWNGDYNGSGSIFLQCTNSRDFSDFHTIVYGHRMRNDSMFGSLRHYREPDYRREHPDIYVVTYQAVRRYTVFAAFEADVKGMVYYQKLDGQEEEFVRFCLDSSEIDTGIVPETGKEILTLSTCTGNGYARRWVVQAVLDQKYERGNPK